MDDNSQQRIHQYHHIDGTSELVLGISYLALGLILAAARLSVVAERLSTILTVLPYVILLLFFGLLWFRRRVTYPRTGVVTPRRPSSFTIGLFVVSIFFGFFHLLLPDDAYLLNSGFPLLFGAFLAVTLLLMGHGLKRFYLYAVLAFTVGIGSVVAGLHTDLGMALVALVIGLVLLVSGGRVLRRYLARTSPRDA